MTLFNKNMKRKAERRVKNKFFTQQVCDRALLAQTSRDAGITGISTMQTKAGDSF